VESTVPAGTAREFERMLTGGHPNSLGSTVAVVDLVLADRSRLEDLLACYRSGDAVVRLRVSSALKRVCQAEPDWVVPHLDRLLGEVAAIDQASTQWTLAWLFGALEGRLSSTQRRRAEEVMRGNLEASDDWIVQNTTMATLGAWARSDAELRAWLLPRLEEFTRSRRVSVANRARKLLAALA